MAAFLLIASILIGSVALASLLNFYFPSLDFFLISVQDIGKNTWYDYFLISIFFIIYLSLIFIFFAPVKLLKKQKINNQHSWVFYCFHGLVWAPLISFLLSRNFLICYLGFPASCQSNVGINLILRALLPIIAYLVYLFLIKPEDLSRHQDRFASGAKSLSNDELSFKAPSLNVAKKIQLISEAVSVVAINGPMGSGKSSFVRMIIENIEKKDRLYSYISLTETNQDNDFSKLFAERWAVTLGERYPKIRATDGVGMLKTILHETTSGWLGEVMDYINNADVGLEQTVSKYYDSAFKPAPNSFNLCPKHISKLFGNVPEFFEKQWIIVIDELERGKLNEIYKVIEIIERFKIESQFGFPIKVVFVVCIAFEETKRLLEHNQSDELAMHINNFFFNNTKNITHIVFVPPTPPSTKLKYIADKFKKLAMNYGIYDTAVDLILGPVSIGITPSSFIDEELSVRTGNTQDSKERYDFIFQNLLKSHPRFIETVFRQTDFFYQGFRKLDTGEIISKQILFSDILGLSYITIKFPYLISYFRATISNYINPSDIQSFSRSMLFDKNPPSLFDNIKAVTGESVPATDHAQVEYLVSVFASFYLDNDKNPGSKDHNSIPFSTSQVGNLYDFLRSIPSQYDIFREQENGSEEVDQDTKFAILYTNHKAEQTNIKNLSLKDLYFYSRFLRNKLGNIEAKVTRSLADEIYKRFDQEEIQFEPRNTDSTDLDNFTYEFIAHIKELAILHSPQGENVVWAAEMSIKFLNNIKISTGIKFIFLNAFVNDNRKSSASYNDLRRAFDEMQKQKPEIIEAVKNVFTEAESRYFSGDATEDLYSKEENFFYVLYQYWSGNPDSSNEIGKIRIAAKKHLKNYPDAIQLYWKAFPYQDSWHGKGYAIVNDIMYGDMWWRTGLSTREIYMTLEELINITQEAQLDDELINKKMQFWGDALVQSDYHNDVKLKPDKETLKASLIDRGILNS